MITLINHLHSCRTGTGLQPSDRAAWRDLRLVCSRSAGPGSSGLWLTLGAGCCPAWRPSVRPCPALGMPPALGSLPMHGGGSSQSQWRRGRGFGGSPLQARRRKPEGPSQGRKPPPASPSVAAHPLPVPDREWGATALCSPGKPGAGCPAQGGAASELTCRSAAHSRCLRVSEALR